MVAFDDVTAEPKTTVAGERRRRCNDAFRKSYQGVDGLESGAGRIASHQRTVVHRLVRVCQKFRIIDSHIAADKQVRVITRRRHQRQNLARGGFDGNDGADFVLHQFLAVCLQIDVESRLDVEPNDSNSVIQSVLVTTLHSVFYVNDINLGALLTAKLLLVRFFDASHAHIIAGLVIRIRLDVLWISLAHIAQNLRCGFILVFAGGTFLNLKTRKLVHLFLQI